MCFGGLSVKQDLAVTLSEVSPAGLGSRAFQIDRQDLQPSASLVPYLLNLFASVFAAFALRTVKPALPPFSSVEEATVYDAHPIQSR